MASEPLTDVQLVALALKGKEAAYRELLELYQRPVFSLIFRMVQNREQAEDLAQESFVRAFQKLDAYDPERKFSNWLFKIAHNHTIDYLRKKGIVTVSLDSATTRDGEPQVWEVASPSPSPEAELEARELGSEIERALSRLRPEYRSVVLLRHVEDRSYEEIAEALELPLGTVKTYLHRARGELKGILSPLRAVAPLDAPT